MNEKVIIHCDKCDSTNVSFEIIPPKPVEVHKTMAQVAKTAEQHIGSIAVYHYTQYLMTCKDCGHSVRYTE